MDQDLFISKLIDTVPPLPAIANRVLHMARQTPVNFHELARVIESDPALSTMVIRLANSPLYGPIRRRVESLGRAIVVLGQNHIIDSAVLYITRNLKSVSKASWPGGDHEFWRHSFGVAVTARMLAQRMNISHAQQSFLAGLIHDVGKLVLNAHDPEGYAEVVKDAAESDRPLYYVELEKYGATHAQIGGLICKKWFLPVTCMKAVAYHHDDPDFITVTVSNIVRSADLLTKIAGIGDGGNPFGIHAIKLLLPHPQFTENDMFKMLDEMADVVEDFSTTVMGERKAARSGFMGNLNNRQNAELLVHTGNESDRLLLKYLLHSLGFKNVTTDSMDDLAEPKPNQIKIMDYMPSYTAPSESIIDFSKWRHLQIETPHNELNLKSLGNWLMDEINRISESRLAHGVSG